MKNASPMASALGFLAKALSDKTDKLILKGSYKMLLRKKFYLQIEFHWYCINLLKKQLNDSNKERNKKINGFFRK